MRKHELPYMFDLLWDVKTYEQVERIANHRGDCSDASPADLVELFQQEDLALPECLLRYSPQLTVWLHEDGTWISYKPLQEESFRYRKARIKGWK